VKARNCSKALYCIPAAFFLITAIIPVFFLDRLTQNIWIVKVNGEPVVLREFGRYVTKYRAHIINRFHNEYGAEKDEYFWDKNFNSETPRDALLNACLEDIVYVKVTQILARDLGIIDNIRYSAFLKKLRKENIRRKEAVTYEQSVYGPIEYEESGYYWYVVNNIGLKLKEKLMNEDCKDESFVESMERLSANAEVTINEKMYRPIKID